MESTIVMVLMFGLFGLHRKYVDDNITRVIIKQNDDINDTMKLIEQNNTSYINQIRKLEKIIKNQEKKIKHLTNRQIGLSMRINKINQEKMWE